MGLGTLYCTHVVLMGAPDYVHFTDKNLWDQTHTQALTEEQSKAEKKDHWIERAMNEYGFRRVGDNPMQFTCEIIPKTEADVKEIEKRIEKSCELLAGEVPGGFFAYDKIEKNSEFSKAAQNAAVWTMNLKQSPNTEGPYHLGPEDDLER